MLSFNFTLLETILLLWFIIYAVILIAYELDGNYKLKIAEALGLLVFLPFVIVLGFIYAIYELTIGRIVDLVKERNKYKNLTKTQNEKIEELKKQIDINIQNENATK